jgi:pimeloyl-ACP methyl ester carboxylesterase
VSSSRSRTALLAGGALAAAGALGWVAARARYGEDFEEVRPDLPESRELTVAGAGGTRLHVEQFGPSDGPALVLVHAWMCSLDLWHRQIAELAPPARIVAFDLRGHGRSAPAADDDYTIEAFADDLDAVLAETLAEGERAVVCGHSMGAMTIAAWALRHPDQVARRASAVALLGTGMGDLLTETLILRTPQALGPVKERVGRVVLSNALPVAQIPEPLLRAGVRQVAFGSDPRDEDVALVAHMVRECAPRVRAGSGGTLSQLDVFEGLGNLDVPTVVIAGLSDRMTPVSHSHRLAELLARPTDVLEVPGAGHMIPLEADRVVIEALRDLLAGARPPARAVSSPG